MTAAATFCATLVDEWIALGITDAVVCPGSRSTPMALAIADSDLRSHMHHDERSAGFMALGLGLASGRPAVVLTTSGTATVNLHPAVVEADLSGVPMVVCTADRPPWLQGRGAPQTIDQRNLYGTSVRSFHDPGVPDAAEAATWRYLGRTVLFEARSGDRPGPVQLNLAFDEPLTGMPDALPSSDSGRYGRRGVSRPTPWPFAEGVRGIIVAGSTIEDPDAIRSLARALGWPVVADPRSALWSDRQGVVRHSDAVLRHAPTAERLRPEAVLRIGEPPASRILNEWIAASGAHEVAVADRLMDPWLSADETIVSTRRQPWVLTWARREFERVDTDWFEGWKQVDAVAESAIAGIADEDPLTEPGVARIVVSSAPAQSAIVLSSSMPVRDAEWFAGPASDGVEVYANRGANGIDGVTSTAVGIALSGRPTVGVLGDVAFLHDANGLLGLAERNVDLTLVVIDNDGGGIFSFLPQAADLPTERFEQLFGTPHGVDLPALAQAHRIDATEVSTRVELEAALPPDSSRLVIVRTNRAANVEVHAAINTAVARALESDPNPS